jgi:nucleotide-binding universal stress UspA family protein
MHWGAGESNVKRQIAIKRILVPIDFSPDSTNALAYARDLAKQFDAELLLLHVIEPIHFITESDVYAHQRHLSATQMESIGLDLREEGRRFRTMVKGGIPSSVIVDTARSAKADLIVIGTHGRTGLAHMWIGSVAEKVVRAASCPVLTVRRAGAKKTKPKATRRRRRP